MIVEEVDACVLVQRILLIRPLADRSMHARNHHPT